MMQANLAIFNELSALLPGRVRSAEPMKKHTTWRIGGPADIFVEPINRQEIYTIVNYSRDRGVPLFVIGAGSNLLISDSGIRGIVVKISSGLDRLSIVDNEIKVEAGARLAQVLAAARDAGLGGFEFLAGIPGNIGGAVFMNAGSNGSSVSELVKKVLILNLDGNYECISNEEMRFGYRTSILQFDPAIVVEVIFTSYPRDKEQIKQEMAIFLARRKASQPLAYPNAGSVFKNPPGDSAGRLIEAAGLKGLRVGDAQISPLHANFIINLGSATARDVLGLIDQVKETINRRFGVKLQPEVKFAGQE
ncbi:MAG: UDP-N-acetylmuramate dehydrogenase [Desulfotomaculaceae bacterium]|nr:UDP-N-acetylmuramate dehydrogenase [Desulfotomaculaceae bacterium]